MEAVDPGDEQIVAVGAWAFIMRGIAWLANLPTLLELHRVDVGWRRSSDPEHRTA